MNARRRWITWLLLYHLLLGTLLLLWGSVLPTTHWTGSLLAFGLPTVQFTWSFTVGLILGPSQKHRRWYWTTLLLSFIPLSFVYVLCWLAYQFLGLSIALLCFSVCLTVLLVETYAGIFYGILAYRRCQDR